MSETRIALALVVARRISKPQRNSFRFESDPLLFFHLISFLFNKADL